MSTLIKDNGIWKEPEMIYVKDQGIWKDVGGGSGLPDIGDAGGGGFLLGAISDYYLIIADKTAEVESIQWKTDQTSTAGTNSSSDGLTNTMAMNDSLHPAAQHCLNYTGGGFDDWYMPAEDELRLFSRNLNPKNPSTPDVFKTGGVQALHESDIYWSSTRSGSYVRGFNSNGSRYNVPPDAAVRVRPVRRVPINL